MHRMACVNVAQLPLQLLLRQHLEWAELPVAVIDRDGITGCIFYRNRQAGRRGIRIGMRYFDALSLLPDLRAGTVGNDALDTARRCLVEIVSQHCPEIEPHPHQPGVFWLKVDGLRRLYPSLERWAQQLRQELAAQRFHAVVAIGWTRFGTYAATRLRTRQILFADLREEQDAVRRVPIERLQFPLELHRELEKLGITTLGDFLSLPTGGIQRRFGRHAYRLHRLASGDLSLPFHAAPCTKPLLIQRTVEPPLADLEPLLLFCKPLLRDLLDIITAPEQGLSRLHVNLWLENGSQLGEQVQPASPTRSSKSLLELLRCKLASVTLAAGVEELCFNAETAPLPRQQLRLFQELPARDLNTAARALARLRAALGDDTVATAVLVQQHLPENCFRWQAFEQLPPAHPQPCSRLPMIRRFFPTPTTLNARPSNRHSATGPPLPCRAMTGPYLLVGNWWHHAVRRRYHFVETQRGEWLWIYYEDESRQWRVQGTVE